MKFNFSLKWAGAVLGAEVIASELASVLELVVNQIDYWFEKKIMITNIIY